MRFFKFDIKYLSKIVLCILFYVIFDIVCPFKRMFGVACPTCGMTTAWLNFMHGDIIAAFVSHRLFFLAPIIVWGCCIKDIGKKDIVLIFVAVLLTANALVNQML